MASLYSLTPLLVLRLICGLFFVPHIVGKFTAREASLNFFRAAGLRPAEIWRWVAMLIEVVLALLLILNIYTHIVGFVSCAYLLVATLAVIKVSKKWLWHIGGCEYPLFWAICCAVVAGMSAP
jgi:putative oxidoreductase